jgi:hypothetical protein
LQGLVLARSGDFKRANQLLAELAAEGAADAETSGAVIPSKPIEAILE